MTNNDPAVLAPLVQAFIGDDGLDAEQQEMLAELGWTLNEFAAYAAMTLLA
jgi:hypothetical protein